MKNKVLGSLALLAVLAVPVQVIVAQQVPTEMQKAETALTASNAMLGSTMTRVMATMPKLKPEIQKQVRMRVQSLESEVRAFNEWMSTLERELDIN